MLKLSLCKGYVLHSNLIMTWISLPGFLAIRSTTDCEKFLKRWEYQTTLPISWETSMKVKKKKLEPDMEQQIDSKLGKEYKAVYC